VRSTSLTWKSFKLSDKPPTAAFSPGTGTPSRASLATFRTWRTNATISSRFLDHHDSVPGSTETLNAAAELGPIDGMKEAIELGWGDGEGEGVGCEPEGLEYLLSRPLNDSRCAFKNLDLDGFCLFIVTDEGLLETRRRSQERRAGLSKTFEASISVYTF
jgi:hypothetical protein